MCSHLFYPIPQTTTSLIEAPIGIEGSTENINESKKEETLNYSDPDRVLECMQRALKIASVSNPNIFVEILDRYIYFYENSNPVIKVSYLSGLVALINEQLEGENEKSPQVDAHYRNTLEYIRIKQNAAETSQRFSEIQLSQ